MKTRENNMDLLRIIAAIMVIAAHVGAIYGSNLNTNYPSYYFTIGNFYHSVTRASVPIFIILSGAFLLNNIKNMNYKYFYKKTLKKIVIPTLIFSFLYVLYSICFGVLLSKMQGIPFNFFKPFIEWIKGNPYYHIWYMYMIIGFYAITPTLINIRKIIGDKKFEISGWICMVLGILFNLTSLNLIWPIQFIPYLGYFILGYSLKKRIKADNKKSYISYLIISIILLISIFIITELSVRFNLLKNNFYFLQPLSPIVVISSICMYISFLKMRNLKMDFSHLAYHTFNIYLLHAGILDTIDLITRHILIENPNPIWYMPVLIIIVFIISYKISVILSKRLKL